MRQGVDSIWKPWSRYIKDSGGSHEEKDDDHPGDVEQTPAARQTSGQQVRLPVGCTPAGINVLRTLARAARSPPSGSGPRWMARLTTPRHQHRAASLPQPLPPGMSYIANPINIAGQARCVLGFAASALVTIHPERSLVSRPTRTFHSSR